MEAFKIARPNVMEHAKKREAVKLSLSPKRKRMETGVEEDSSPVRKRTRAGRRAQQSSQQVVIVDSEDDDEDYMPGMFGRFPIDLLLSHNRTSQKARRRLLSHLPRRVSDG